MTGDYLAACIHQDRHDEAERLDAARDLADLFGPCTRGLRGSSFSAETG
jgi:hypothetical protein